VNPGASAAQIRWRVGAWLVGIGLLAPLLDVTVLGGGASIVMLGVFLMALGALVANPFRTVTRMRAHGRPDPLVRLRPLGLFQYLFFFVAVVLPFAVGEWLLRLLAEAYERRGRVVEDAADTWGGDGPVVFPVGSPHPPAPRRGAFRRRGGPSRRG
jgi:hypothetical protein